LAVVAVAVSLLLAGCSDSSPDSSSSPSVASSSVTPAPSTAGRGLYREVEFTAYDGVPRQGRLFGEGTVGVVLSHMGRAGDDQDNWASFASALANRGYLVLTPARTSFAGGWTDVLASAEYLRDHGAEKVIAGGASIGAMASLYAAEQPDSDLVGVIWLAGILSGSGYDFREADVSAVACPMLIIAGDRDAFGAASAARRLHDWATAPKQLLILPTRLHGTVILERGGPDARKLTRAMVDFVDRVADGSTTCS
jgi:hypothetical protein